MFGCLTKKLTFLFRLIREICFFPYLATAVTFLNGLDILVALQNRLCVVECSKFLTKSWIDQKNLVKASFCDDLVENAISYNDEIG